MARQRDRKKGRRVRWNSVVSMSVNLSVRVSRWLNTVPLKSPVNRGGILFKWLRLTNYLLMTLYIVLFRVYIVRTFEHQNRTIRLVHCFYFLFVIGHCSLLHPRGKPINCKTFWNLQNWRCILRFFWKYMCLWPTNEFYFWILYFYSSFYCYFYISI